MQAPRIAPRTPPQGFSLFQGHFPRFWHPPSSFCPCPRESQAASPRHFSAALCILSPPFSQAPRFQAFSNGVSQLSCSVLIFLQARFLQPPCRGLQSSLSSIPA